MGGLSGEIQNEEFEFGRKKRKRAVDGVIIVEWR